MLIIISLKLVNISLELLKGAETIACLAFSSAQTKSSLWNAMRRYSIPLLRDLTDHNYIIMPMSVEKFQGKLEGITCDFGLNQMKPFGMKKQR